MSDSPSYVDYETFLSPSFSPELFANSLILSTNNPTDTTLDLSTPLSRVLFDIQEIDTHIHNLTTRSALPILNYVKSRDEASKRILGVVEGEVGTLRSNYERLEKEVLERYKEAEKMRVVSLRSLEVLRLGREVGRAVALGRQLEIQVSEAGLNMPGRAGKEDHRVMVRASYTILEFRGLVDDEAEEKELQRVNIVKTLKTDLFAVVEEKIKNKAQQIIREFSISNLTSPAAATTTSTQAGAVSSTTTTYQKTEDAKARTTSAVTILYLLSYVIAPPSSSNGQSSTIPYFHPTLLLTALQTFLQNALTSSLASISRALTTLPTLDRTLLEVSARCQNIAALEVLLSGIKCPHHPFLNSSSSSSSNPRESEPEPPGIGDEADDDKDDKEKESNNLLVPLLMSLDTSSLPSYFWRSLAAALSARVQEILSRGGVSARTLRSNRERVGGAIRECVLRGGEVPGGIGVKRGKGVVVNWEREAAVMVGSVVGVLSRG
ncbi:hypothetical protein EPUS_00234 [Endocarpon pusillum Z07020]|uniref:Conserved oligomeric Golgi complex subunit 5 n=1 Tax=Endocarpon pusillum (strain Z07020 / HMAS-L-300199) TaxID=1263415 RepID=U1GTU2_ENDPU|nr:uncharacterized protein EPUS_00234 [Endocarpon pusillum Z07020]ERF75441.1 hypothetical protein EPUS_00234 [Endocarpon pusillum Z07020]